MPELITVIQDEDSGQEVPITPELRMEARRIHEDITHHGARTVEHLVAMGQALRTMRDRKLYTALDCRSFGSYCETALGMTRQWADAQIKAAEVLNGNPGLQSVSVSQLRLLARIPAGEQTAFLAEHPLHDMTKRETEAAVAEWRAKAERAQHEANDERRLREEAEAKVRRLESVPPRQVLAPDPRQAVEIDRLRQELTQKERQLAELQTERTTIFRELQQMREQVDRDASLGASIKEKEERLRQIAEMEGKMGAAFEDGDRDPNGGLQLMEVLFPVERVLPRALSVARTLQQRGVGGWMQDDDVKRLADQLKDLARQLESILKDRAGRAINVTPMEVQ